MRRKILNSNKSIFSVDQDFSALVEKNVIKLLDFLPEQSQETAKRCLDLCKRNEFVIMIAGEISVGKSSFLNALMGAPILLTDTTETTAAITYLKTAEGVAGIKKDHVKITYKDGAVEWIPIGDSERLKIATTSLDGNQKAISRVKMAEVYCSKETLDIPPGVTIIDTPGLNGSDSHAELTHREMGLCHVALFLLDASKFGTLSNREEFGRLYRYAPEVLFVVNKWDLVRSVGGTLSDMKKEYFEKLGNWACKGEVSDDNIYVVSGKEAFIAREKFIEILKNIPSDDWLGVSLVKQLPYPDNEFFALESKIKEIVEDSQKVSLVRKRPLMTLSLLTKDCLDDYEKKIEVFLSVDAELEKRIENEKFLVNQRRDDAEGAFTQVRDYAKRLVVSETKAYRKIIESATVDIQRNIFAKIKRTEPGDLMTENGLDQMSRYVQKQIENKLRHPICDRFSTFVTYIQNLLESNTKVNVGETSFFTHADSLKDSLKELNEERNKLETKMSRAGSKRAQLELNIKYAQSAIAHCDNEIFLIKNKEKEYEKFDRQLKALIGQRESLGPRPRPIEKKETEEYRIKKSRGIFGSILHSLKSFFVDDDDYEYKTRVVTKVDDSNVRAWDREHEKISKRIEEKRRERNRHKVDLSAIQRQMQEKQNQEKILRKSERELKKLEDEIQQHQNRMSTLGENSARQLSQEYWGRELNHVKESFESMVDGFYNEVDSLLKRYWNNRTKRVDKYLLDFVLREKQLVDDRKKNSEEYEQLCKGVKTLKGVLMELENELNKMAS